MKTRIILFLAISAITTFSFTFASINGSEKAKVEQRPTNISIEPIGGLMAEDKL